MSDATFKAVRFVPPANQDFAKILRKRVNSYFKTNQIAKTGDYRIWIKVVVLTLVYLVPFVLILTNTYFNSMLVFYGLWLIMGIGLAGVGFSIMHDAVHGALSKKKWVNDWVGKVMYLAGGSVLNWRIQHNVLHHSYTNIDGYDEDIDPAGLMRFSPHQPIKPFYRFQAFYAWFVYALMSFSWTTGKDFISLNRYHKKGLLKTQGTTYQKEFFRLILLKIGYYAFFVVLPIVVLDVAWWHVILGWLSMHFLAGLILSCVFQPAHVVPMSDFPKPSEDNLVEEDWAKMQLATTANFAPKSRLLSWYVGGLNYQIEHHLFPNICHVHHKAISKIVQSTAKEFGLAYNSQATFVGALFNHAKLLHSLRK